MEIHSQYVRIYSVRTCILYQKKREQGYMRQGLKNDIDHLSRRIKQKDRISETFDAMRRSKNY